MKQLLCILTAGVLSLTADAYTQEKSQEEKKADKKASAEVTVVGEVIDSRCYLSMGAKGEDHRQCAIDCANGGIPLAILEDKTGNVYFVGNANDQMKGANEMLVDHAAQKVTVKGKLVERGGARMIITKTVEMKK